MYRKGKRLTITTNSFTKIDQHDRLRPLWGSEWKNSALSTEEPIRLQDLLNSVRSQAEKKIIKDILIDTYKEESSHQDTLLDGVLSFSGVKGGIMCARFCVSFLHLLSKRTVQNFVFEIED